MEAGGLTFRDAAGESQDCLLTLRDFGLNTVRLRVFVAPSGDPVNGHCSPEETVALAVRAKKLGYHLMIDFHYSDTWADPKNQSKPSAWAELDLAGLKQAVYDHTRAVLLALEKADARPEWVQVGNEIPSGLLWPDGHTDHPANLAQLINAGYDAVKSVDPGIQVIVHLHNGHDHGLYRWFFDQLNAHGGRYDIIGLSYYPFWTEKDYTATIDALGRNLNDLVARYGKPVMVVEVGGRDDQPENTREMIGAVLEKVRQVPENRGLGVLYWEPQGAFSWSKYGLSAWGNDGRPTSALEGFR
jgi:arabinogalactan endo-1,4-beta-galactosidase